MSGNASQSDDWKAAHQRVGAAWHRLVAFVQEDPRNIGDLCTLVSVPLPDGLCMDLTICRQRPDRPVQRTTNPIILHPPKAG